MEFKLTRQRWSQREDGILRQLYGSEPVAKIACTLDRSEVAVRKRASHLQLKSSDRRRIEPRKTWTDAEERILIEEFCDTSTRALAKKLNRSETAIINRARILGLKNRYAPNE